jgi:hypothetical protein
VKSERRTAVDNLMLGRVEREEGGIACQQDALRRRAMHSSPQKRESARGQVLLMAMTVKGFEPRILSGS